MHVSVCRQHQLVRRRMIIISRTHTDVNPQPARRSTMHYSSHPPRAFRNRIARNLGVLVAAALVAALGLPSAVQAQTPAAPTVDRHRRRQDWPPTPPPLLQCGGSRLVLKVLPVRIMWLLEYTEPGVAWAKATEDDRNARAIMRTVKVSLRMTHGSITASGDFACPTMTRTAETPRTALLSARRAT